MSRGFAIQHACVCHADVPGGISSQAAGPIAYPTSGTTSEPILATLPPLTAGPFREAVVLPAPARLEAAIAAAALTPNPNMLAAATSVTEPQAEEVQEVVGTPQRRSPVRAARMQAAFEQMSAASGGAAARAEAPTLYQGILSQHNTYRAVHSAPAMSWDTTLASSAATYAAQCKWEHDQNNPAGENLYATTGKDFATALSAAIKAW